MSDENITTLHMLEPADPINNGDLLYVVQGSGSDRDRKVTAGELFNDMGAHKVKVNGGDETPKFLEDTLEIKNPGPDSSNSGDIGFEAVDTRGGKLMAGYIKQGKIKREMLASDFCINGETNLDDISISSRKLMNNSVTQEKLAVDSVSPAKIDQNTEEPFVFKNIKADSVECLGADGKIKVTHLTPAIINAHSVQDEELNLYNLNGVERGRIRFLYNVGDERTVYFRYGNQYSIKIPSNRTMAFVYIDKETIGGQTYHIWSPLSGV